MKIGGKEINNWWLVGGGLGVVVAVWWYRKSSASSASTSSSASSASQIDPVTGLPYSQDNEVDPATGLTYLAEAQQYGSVQAAEQMVASGSAYYGDTGAGYAQDYGYPTGYYPGGSSSGTTTPTVTGYATNAQWASAVQAGLVGLGYSSEAVATALGLFFAQHPLTSDQANIIQVAEAEFGPPPQGTYSIIPTPGPPPSSGDVTVPNVVGIDANNAAMELEKAGLTYAANLMSSGKPGYLRKVYDQNPKAGAKVARGTYVHVDWHYSKE